MGWLLHNDLEGSDAPRSFLWRQEPASSITATAASLRKNHILAVDLYKPTQMVGNLLFRAFFPFVKYIVPLVEPP